MKSEDKIEVTVKPLPEYKKLVTFIRLLGEDNVLVPSFEDLFRIIQAICFCEDIKYPPPRYKGREFPREFLNRCCDVFGSDEMSWQERVAIGWEELRKEFKLPNRD